TPARLEQIAQELWGVSRAAVWQEETRAVAQPSPSSPTTHGVKDFLPRQVSEAPTSSPEEAMWSRKSGVDGLAATVFTDPPGRVPALSCLPVDPLLATKLHVPRPRPQLVHRPRLIQRLQQGMERP